MAACIKLGRQSPINYSKNPTSFNYLYIHKPKPTPKTLKSNPNLEEEQMTGIGSPCGACKFLRRKCTRGCVFAPYFCHEQGAAQFAAVHKVFGASNVSKLLAHLPVTNRPEAAQTLSYEAQARLQDPIYGCVSHIFALQQQVVNLQAQLASLKAQETQCYANGSSSSSSSSQNDYNLRSEFTNFHQFSSSSMNYENGFMSSSSNDYSCQNYEARSYGNGENDSFDMGDLQSVAIAYLNRA